MKTYMFKNGTLEAISSATFGYFRDKFDGLTTIYFDTDSYGNATAKVNWSCCGDVTPEEAERFAKGISIAVDFAKDFNNEHVIIDDYRELTRHEYADVKKIALTAIKSGMNVITCLRVCDYGEEVRK